jgi:molecular chaperone GrpE
MSEDRQSDSASANQGLDPDTAQAAVEAARKEAEESWNKYLRTAAEFDNFRKRSARDLDLARKYGAERLAQGILPVRDSLEAGLAASSAADTDALIKGQEATLRLLDDALTTAGVTVIDPKGELFDPSKHEALSMLPAPHAAPNTVIEVVQKGYQLHDRLLRAAKVIVARGEDP